MVRLKFEDLTKETLWQLRGEIVLNSLFTTDFENSFGFAAKSVQDFFDGYVDYLLDLASGDGLKTLDDVVAAYDNADNLFDFYWNCDDYSWFKYDPEWTEEENEEYERHWNG